MRHRPPPLPTLHTLNQPPTWCNRNGRVDRSACLKLPTSRVWRRVFPSDWQPVTAEGPIHPEARALYYLTYDDLDFLKRRQPPRRLVGDHRRKAQATRIPNLGAISGKVLGLPPDWSQPLTLERWRLHDRLAQHFFLCPHCHGKFRTLLLPLPTADEYADAQTLAAWLHHHPGPVLPPEVPHMTRRYATLLPPRRVLCNRCLGVRYGEHKPKQPSILPV